MKNEISFWQAILFYFLFSWQKDRFRIHNMQIIECHRCAREALDKKRRRKGSSRIEWKERGLLFTQNMMVSRRFLEKSNECHRGTFKLMIFTIFPDNRSTDVSFSNGVYGRVGVTRDHWCSSFPSAAVLSVYVCKQMSKLEHPRQYPKDNGVWFSNDERKGEMYPPSGALQFHLIAR